MKLREEINLARALQRCKIEFPELGSHCSPGEHRADWGRGRTLGAVALLVESHDRCCARLPLGTTRCRQGVLLHKDSTPGSRVRDTEAVCA